MSFEKFLRTPFLQSTSGRLLLERVKSAQSNIFSLIFPFKRKCERPSFEDVLSQRDVRDQRDKREDFLSVLISFDSSCILSKFVQLRYSEAYIKAYNTSMIGLFTILQKQFIRYLTGF